MTDSLRARILINLSAVLYEQSAARPSLSAKVGNIDLNFVPGVAFISNVYIADSLRARTLINLSAVLYEQAAAQTSLSAKVGNIDLDFVPSVAFISNVYIADSLRARTLINLSAVLYEQAAARTGLFAEVSNIFLFAEVGIIDLNFVPSVAFDAIGNVELTGDLLGNADCVNNNNNNVSDADLGDDDDVQLVRDNMKELIYITGNNRNNLNIIVTDPTSREFSRVDMKSSTGLCLLIDRAKANRLIWIADVADVFDTVKQALYFMWDKEQDYSAEEHDYCKFYRLVITGEDTHCKQTIKKVYIMLLERALLILFIT
ncbi:hypothetical protein HBH51_089690 [Parastagonospora nodorum]|nr:hypothetical protein HBH51_089690 [Parastagonospora nodorum]